MLQVRDDIVALDSAIIQHPGSGRPPVTSRGSPTRSSSASASARALARGDPPRGAARRRARRGRDPLPGVRGELSEPRQFNLMFETYAGRSRTRARRSTCGRRPRRDLHQLQEHPAVRPQEAAVRDRPDRQILPQRDHPGELHLPDPRVRADGDGVLRRRPTPRVARARLDGADAGTPTSASGRRSSASAPTAPTNSPTTPPRPRTSSTSSRWGGRSSRESLIAATSTSPSTRSSPARSSSTSTPARASATSPMVGRRRRPGDARVHGRRL